MKLRPVQLLFCILSCLLIVVSAFAQDTSKESLKQREMMIREFGITDAQAIQIQKFSFIRSRQIDSLNKLRLSPKELAEQRESVTDIYYAKVISILTPEQVKAYPVDALKAARTNEITGLELSPRMSVKLGLLKADYEKALKNLPENKRERKNARQNLESKYACSVKSLIGDDKFNEWMAFRNSKLERVFMNNFGFTKEQFLKYQELENMQAVEIMKIRSLAIPKEEKKSRIRAVKEAKIESLRDILPSEQFSKWYKSYHQKETRNK